jgi:tetratricopeptide (TPR) repeat protein
MSVETSSRKLDFAGLYGPEALHDWERFLAHFEFGDGFSLLVLLLPGPTGDRVCEQELKDYLRAQGREMAVLRFQHPSAVRELSDRLFGLETPPSVGAVWVGSFPSEILLDLKSWKAAWRQGLAMLNQHRNPLRRRFSTPLVFAGPSWLQEVMREAAPDLWSVRTSVVRINSEPVDRAGRENIVLSEEVDTPPSADAAADPDYALELAERVRNKQGQPAVQVALLLRAGWGFVQAARAEAAEGAFRRAVMLGRQLAQKTPEVFLPKLAESLSGLAVALRQSAKLEESLDCGRESLKIYRELARQQPKIYQPDVAVTLNNLGNVQRDLSNLDAARANYEQALRIVRELAQQQPEVYRVNVAGTLNNLGNVERVLRNLQAAQTIFREALGIWRELAQQRPEVYRVNVAGTMNNLGILQSNLNDLDGARASFGEALGIYRELAQQRPEVYAPEMAGTINNLGIVQSGLKDLEAARASFGEALGIYRPLAQQRPKVFRRDVATTLNNLGIVYSDLKDLQAARDSLQEALGIYRELAILRPETYQSKIALLEQNLKRIQAKKSPKVETRQEKLG